MDCALRVNVLVMEALLPYQHLYSIKVILLLAILICVYRCLNDASARHGMQGRGN